MKNKAGGVLIVLLSTLCLSGCMYLHEAGGPCYGFGCHESAPAQTAQSTAPPAAKGHKAKAFAKNRAPAPKDVTPGN
jgi:hypothetical protein